LHALQNNFHPLPPEKEAALKAKIEEETNLCRNRGWRHRLRKGYKATQERKAARAKATKAATGGAKRAAKAAVTKTAKTAGLGVTGGLAKKASAAGGVGKSRGQTGDAAAATGADSKAAGAAVGVLPKLAPAGANRAVLAKGANALAAAAAGGKAQGANGSEPAAAVGGAAGRNQGGELGDLVEMESWEGEVEAEAEGETARGGALVKKRDVMGKKKKERQQVAKGSQRMKEVTLDAEEEVDDDFCEEDVKAGKRRRLGVGVAAAAAAGAGEDSRPARRRKQPADEVEAAGGGEKLETAGSRKKGRESQAAAAPAVQTPRRSTRASDAAPSKELGKMKKVGTPGSAGGAVSRGKSEPGTAAKRRQKKYKGLTGKV
jgi:hypothetical protein